ncbi:uracil-DNA glycosylase [Cocleimonas sp. KMM 6892]|uniref:uracil-DNA glycosylase n=1 Tax=unclassified Cocleimonas TaxID=2639732 RepID=UPI002DC0495C|nr:MULTISPECIES: uracil-DNA glycosylase [unclassified Cocleimonas]MEB8433746.1 uracil-DNA glycosylase [Cocleimonas sp. KMM 6892]MEC4716557.1 uracil-DNA glycosylase [Cocleimonas sp. KMM 6895]MEC4746288.1 uracil-DNA glycosylase [Cocleimonas sp. KMM 6896]
MTSPAQLNYLNAMGIPVWVSRELVIDEALVIDEGRSASTSSASSNAVPSQSAERTADNSSSGSNAIENILQDLEQKEDKSRTARARTSEASQAASETIRQITETLESEPTASKQAPTNLPNVFNKTVEHTVYAEGSLDAKWMIIGQNPEFIEHEHGQPYNKEEGVLMENMLRAVGIPNPRNDAYLVNVLRNSQQNETDAKVSKAELNVILQECIKQVQPEIIVIVGQLAAQNILHSDEPLARLRGKPFTLPETNIHIVVTYYPSYLLSKPSDKRKAWEDLKLAISLID